MDEFLTDDQQAEKAKHWLRENGVFLVAGVVLGLGVLFGWQSWESSRSQIAGEASVVWVQLGEAIDGERYNEVTEILQLLKEEYAATPYLDQGLLAVARMHMDRNMPDEAIDTLHEIVTGSGDKELRRVAELRIAQIYLYLEHYDDALAILGQGEPTAFVGQYHELRGDIFFAQGRLEDSRDEYQLALVTDTAGVIDRNYVQMKLDDVSGSVAALPASVQEVEGEAATVDETAGEPAAEAE